jgi:plasmid maintenance system antidote protein VapI
LQIKQGLAMTTQNLAARIERIRLPHKLIAETAPIDPNTVSRIVNGAGALTSSVEKIERVVEAEEKQLLAYLIDLHGVPT